MSRPACAAFPCQCARHVSCVILALPGRCRRLAHALAPLFVLYSNVAPQGSLDVVAIRAAALRGPTLRASLPQRAVRCRCRCRRHCRHRPSSLPPLPRFYRRFQVPRSPRRLAVSPSRRLAAAAAVAAVTCCCTGAFFLQRRNCRTRSRRISRARLVPSTASSKGA